MRLVFQCECGSSHQVDLKGYVVNFALQVAPIPVRDAPLHTVGCRCGRDIEISASPGKATAAYAEVRIKVSPPGEFGALGP